MCNGKIECIDIFEEKEGRNIDGTFKKGHKNFKKSKNGKSKNGKSKNNKCKIDGCAKDILSRDMCGKHYQRWKKYKSPYQNRPIIKKTKTGKYFSCKVCKKSFYRHLSEIKKHYPIYCSKE